MGFSNGCAELALKIPPPLVPSSLIASWLAVGRQRDRRGLAVDAGDVDPGVQAHRHPERDQHDRRDERDRQQHPDRAADQVDPEVADLIGGGADEPAHQRHRDGHAHRGGDEVLHGQPGHLDQVTHHRLRHVRLPVRVGHERHRGVERDPRIHRAAVQAQRQQRLQPLKQVQQQHRQERKRQHRRGVTRPALLGVGVDAGQPVHDPFHPPVPLAGVRRREEVPERHVHRREQRHQQDDLQEPGGRRGHQNFSGRTSATNKYTNRPSATTPPITFCTITAAATPATSPPTARTRRRSARHTRRRPSRSSSAPALRP